MKKKIDNIFVITVSVVLVVTLLTIILVNNSNILHSNPDHNKTNQPENQHENNNIVTVIPLNNTNLDTGKNYSNSNNVTTRTNIILLIDPNVHNTYITNYFDKVIILSNKEDYYDNDMYLIKIYGIGKYDIQKVHYTFKNYHKMTFKKYFNVDSVINYTHDSLLDPLTIIKNYERNYNMMVFISEVEPVEFPSQYMGFNVDNITWKTIRLENLKVNPNYTIISVNGDTMYYVKGYYTILIPSLINETNFIVLTTEKNTIIPYYDGIVFTRENITMITLDPENVKILIKKRELKTTHVSEVLIPKPYDVYLKTFGNGLLFVDDDSNTRTLYYSKPINGTIKLDNITIIHKYMDLVSNYYIYDIINGSNIVVTVDEIDSIKDLNTKYSTSFRRDPIPFLEIYYVLHKSKDLGTYCFANTSVVNLSVNEKCTPENENRTYYVTNSFTTFVMRGYLHYVLINTYLMSEPYIISQQPVSVKNWTDNYIILDNKTNILLVKPNSDYSMNIDPNEVVEIPYNGSMKIYVKVLLGNMTLKYILHPVNNNVTDEFGVQLKLDNDLNPISITVLNSTPSFTNVTSVYSEKHSNSVVLLSVLNLVRTSNYTISKTPTNISLKTGFDDTINVELNGSVKYINYILRFLSNYILLKD